MSDKPQTVFYCDLDEANVVISVLREEIGRLKKQIIDDNRAYGCELRDPYGTIWAQAKADHARAETAERDLGRWRELARFFASWCQANLQDAVGVGVEMRAALAELERLIAQKKQP